MLNLARNDWLVEKVKMDEKIDKIKIQKLKKLTLNDYKTITELAVENGGGYPFRMCTFFLQKYDILINVYWF